MKQILSILVLSLVIVTQASAFEALERRWDGSVIMPPKTQAEYNKLKLECAKARRTHCMHGKCNAISIYTCPYNNFEPPAWEELRPRTTSN